MLQCSPTFLNQCSALGDVSSQQHYWFTQNEALVRFRWHARGRSLCCLYTPHILASHLQTSIFITKCQRTGVTCPSPSNPSCPLCPPRHHHAQLWRLLNDPGLEAPQERRRHQDLSLLRGPAWGLHTQVERDQHSRFKGKSLQGNVTTVSYQ